MQIAPIRGSFGAGSTERRHGFWGPLDASFLAVRRSLPIKTALVTYIVSGGLYNPGTPPAAMVRNAREADLVFANCNYLSRLVHERIGVKAGVRYDGIDRRFFFPAFDTAGDHPLTVLFAGSLRPYKRAELRVGRASVFALSARGKKNRTAAGWPRNLAAQM